MSVEGHEALRVKKKRFGWLNAGVKEETLWVWGEGHGAV